MEESAEPEDFEAACQPIKVDRHPRSGGIVSVRLTEEEIDRVEKLAEARHTTISQLAHEAIRSFLDLERG
jgi:hypothetical protein